MCRKQRYPSRKAAQKAKRALYHIRGHDLTTYRCTIRGCTAWHLTSKHWR